MSLLLKNVLLEKSYIYEDDCVIATETELVDLVIDDGVFTKIEPAITDEHDHVFDAQGQLLLPAFRDMHIHLDKTYFGDKWQAPIRPKDGIRSRIAQEQQLLPAQLPVMKERAIYVIKHLIANGHTHIRTHCNVDQSIGTQHVEMLMDVLQSFAPHITYELVAFPQHGLMRDDVYPLMNKALQLGATHVGGVDPATIDPNLYASLEQTVQLAVTAQKGIDLHLHDNGSLGLYELHVLCDLLEKYQFAHDVTISQAFALATASAAELAKLLPRLQKHNITIATTVPFHATNNTIPIPKLKEAGISVVVGHDSLMDHWSPFGSGNTLQKLQQLAQCFGCNDEQSIGQVLRYATGNITPLNEQGVRVWPAVGQPATAVLVDAVSSAHAIARICPITTVFHNGHVTFERQIELQGAYRH